MKISSMNDDGVLTCQCAICVEDERSKRKMLTQRRDVTTKNTAVGGGSDFVDMSDNPTATRNAADSSDCYSNNDDRCDAHHSDVAQYTDDDDRNPSDGCRVNKSVLFGTEPKRPSGNADGDKDVMSRMYRSLPRPQQRNGQRQQHNQPTSKVAPAAPPFQTSRNTSSSDRDWLSVKAGLRDRKERRSTSASRLTTKKDTDVSEKLNSSGNWSTMEHPVDDKQRCPATDRHRRCPTSINWFVDLTDSASTECRPATSLATGSADRLRQYQRGCGRNAGSKPSPDAVNDGNKLEPKYFRRATWSDTSGRRGRATTRSTLDMRHDDTAETTNTSALTSPPVELGEKSTVLQCTLSSKANRKSELRTSKNPGNENLAFHRSNVQQFRRSVIATRPKDAEMFIHAGSAVQPSERGFSRGSTRARSSSLSEQYRMSIGGDWFDNFATSSAVAKQQKVTPVSGSHKPLAMSRELKPDFVIYV